MSPWRLPPCLLAGRSRRRKRAQVSALRGADFQLEEILVTARKKVENLQSVPIAIDAFSAAMLDEKAINTLEGIAKYSTSLTFDQGVLPNDTRPVIRGVNITRGRPNVGILVDGIDVSSETLTVAGGGAFTNLGLLDLERIEVIKGPQSVTYGRSAFAGAVNYVTKRPGPTKAYTAMSRASTDEHGYWQGAGQCFFRDYGKPGHGPYGTAAPIMTATTKTPIPAATWVASNQIGAAHCPEFHGENDFSAYFRGEYADDKYTPRADSERQSLSNVSEPGDFFHSGSLGTSCREPAHPGWRQLVPRVHPG